MFNSYMVGSQSAGSKLRHAFFQYSQRACEKSMGEGVGDFTEEELKEGIAECAEAATEELSTLLQEELLRSVQYGEEFVDLSRGEAAHAIPSIAKRLRVLNALRAPEVGLYLTNTEFECLAEKAVLARLLSRRLYYLAVKVASELRREA